ncbi:MAG: VOC family protein [Gammaproteobacteria bacterium]
MNPISHITLGTNDAARAADFYDAVLGVLDWARIPKPPEKPPAYCKNGKPPYLFLCLPENGLPATWGNGTHIAFAADSREQVRRFYARATECGGADEGAPGPRPHYGEHYYAAYIRDLDGNKLQAVCHSPA